MEINQIMNYLVLPWNSNFMIHDVAILQAVFLAQNCSFWHASQIMKYLVLPWNTSFTIHDVTRLVHHCRVYLQIFFWGKKCIYMWWKIHYLLQFVSVQCGIILLMRICWRQPITSVKLTWYLWVSSWWPTQFQIWFGVSECTQWTDAMVFALGFVSSSVEWKPLPYCSLTVPFPTPQHEFNLCCSLTSITFSE